MDKIKRPSYDETFMEVARIISKRGTCPRLSVGCVITKNNRIIATGYNGSPPRQPHCIDEGCLMVDDHCIRATHAEMNATFEIKRDTDLTAYITHYTCKHCAKALISIGVTRIVCTWDYYDYYSEQFLKAAGIEVVTIN